MNLPTPSREEEIFAALVALPLSERMAYLEKACGGDEALRQRIQRLLQSHDEAEGFMQGPAATEIGRAVAQHAPAAPQENAGQTIGRYKLLQKIGEGGCGIVYLAEQQEPVRRRVALKVIKLGMDTKEVIARFEAERQALALMDHPNIARVFDAGATDAGRPFFVMELVRGVPITKYCDEQNLPTKARLELFTQVCHALHHAHQKGIIHRDVKPSNILVTLHDGVPVPKVIDFGIAKATQGRLTDSTLFTAFEQFIGTPAYMSPEQAEMSGLDIDTRSDIYSLGVLLYELLTGRPPFDPKTLLSAGLDEIRRIIREIEPPRPSARLRTLAVLDRATVAKQHGTVPARLSLLLRADLDWVVMKALEKDRTRRYETASELAQDLLRYLRDEPVAARPPNAGYRFQKLIRRHKFAAAIAVVLTLIGGLSVATWHYIDVRIASIRPTPAERVATSESRKGTPDAQVKNELQKKGTPAAQVKSDVLPVLKDAVPIFNDTFSDGERSTQNLPSSVAWYLGQTRPALSVRNGVLELDSPGHSRRAVWAYFPLLTVKVGEAVTFSCDFTFEGEIQNENFILRMALCHTNRVAPRTSDGPSPTGAYRGYASLFNGPMGIAKRDGTGAVHPQTAVLWDLGDESNRIWRILGTGNGPSLIYRSNVPYTATFTIVRTSTDTMTVTSGVTDVNVNARSTTTQTDSSNIFFNFDTVVFHLGSHCLTGVMRFSRASLATTTSHL